MRAFFIKILKSDLVKVVTFAYREYAIEFRDQLAFEFNPH